MSKKESVIPGWYDDGGHPCASFHLRGVKHKPPGIEYTGMIDTGFTGFIQMPLTAAFSLRLPLEGTASVILANGTTQETLTALGAATFQGETKVGVVHLSPSNQILLGMEFLRTFRHALAVFPDTVVLFPADKPDEKSK